MIYQFVRLLSQNYQGLEPLDEAPTYDFEHILPGSVDRTAYGKIPTPDLDHQYSLREIAPHYRADRVKPARVDIRLTCAQIKQLHAAAQAEIKHSDSEAFLSRQDVIAGLMVYCISHAEPHLPPIQSMSTIVMVRM